MRDYLPLIGNNSVTHMHGLAVYVKEGLLFGTHTLKTLQVLSYVFNWFHFTQCFSSLNQSIH